MYFPLGIHWQQCVSQKLNASKGKHTHKHRRSVSLRWWPAWSAAVCTVADWRFLTWRDVPDVLEAASQLRPTAQGVTPHSTVTNYYTHNVRVSLGNVFSLNLKISMTFPEFKQKKKKGQLRLRVILNQPTVMLLLGKTAQRTVIRYWNPSVPWSYYIDIDFINSQNYAHVWAP